MFDLSLVFKKVCVNRYPAVEYRVSDGKVTSRPALYRRSDLSDWAEEAFEKGETSFYAEPVDPANPYGKLRLCEPKYVYELKRSLTVEEYNALCELLSQNQ